MDEITKRMSGSICGHCGGRADDWKCPKCGKGVVGKPKGEKGKIMIRAKKYVCPECSFEKEKKEYEEMLTASIEYTCPECTHKGEAQIPFKRKKIEGTETLRFQCRKCGINIDITKKMK